MKGVFGPILFVIAGVLLILFNRRVARMTELAYASRLNNWVYRLSYRFKLTRAVTIRPRYYHVYWIGVGVLLLIVGLADLWRLVLLTR
jgi:hypothetical protein